jgi:hypothetical protein
MQYLDPLVIGIALFVVLLQLSAFLRASRHAQQMARLFAIDPVEIDSAPASPVNEGADGLPPTQATSQLQFRLRQVAGDGTPASELIERTNLSTDVPNDVEAHLSMCSTIATQFAERYDSRAAVMVGVPVYLGLMGTFAGIIVGLIRLSAGTQFSETSIQAFLAGVLVAMTSSLTGVTLMVAANALVLPRARRLRDQGMARYLAALKRELLARMNVITAQTKPQPVLATALHELARSMDAFNRSIEPQRQLLEMLQKLDLAGIAKVNVDLLGQAKPLLERLTEVDKAIATMTSALNGTTQLISGVTLLMDRIKSFEGNINALGQKLATDDTVTAKTIEIIQGQITKLKAGSGLVEQYVNEQDVLLKEFALQYRGKVESIANKASQMLDAVGEQITKEVRESAEPERVATLLDHVGVLPEILRALEEPHRADADARREMTDAIATVAASAAQLATIVERLENDRLGKRLGRWMRSWMNGNGDHSIEARPTRLSELGDPKPRRSRAANPGEKINNKMSAHDVQA